MNVEKELAKIKADIDKKRELRLAKSNTGWVPAEKGNQGSDPDSDDDIDTPTADDRDSIEDATSRVLAQVSDLLQQASALVQKAKVNRSASTQPTDQQFNLVSMTPAERSRWLANPENRRAVFEK